MLKYILANILHMLINAYTLELDWLRLCFILTCHFIVYRISNNSFYVFTNINIRKLKYVEYIRSFNASAEFVINSWWCIKCHDQLTVFLCIPPAIKLCFIKCYSVWFKSSIAISMTCCQISILSIIINVIPINHVPC